MDIKKLIRRVRARVCGHKLVVVAVQSNQVLVLDQDKNVGCLEGEVPHEFMKLNTVVWALANDEKVLEKITPGSYKNKDCRAKVLYYDKKRQMWLVLMMYDGCLAFLDAVEKRYHPGDTAVFDFSGQKVSLPCFTV